MRANKFYFTQKDNVSRYFNLWDTLLLLLVVSVLFFLGWAGSQMATPYHLGEPLPISLKIQFLPLYALRTVVRMFIALLLSLLFTFIVGTIAAKNARAERIIIPAIDILQSVPVLSFLAITVTGFIHLFPNSLLGPECACIFVIFTAQVWNITFGFYQSLKTVPHNLVETAAIFQLSSWQKFWKIEVPFSMPGLLWNMMMSMSASWFFVVLSEAISVAHQNIRLPGVGSYIALAIENKDLHALGYAIITMIIVIFLYDQILFRPLITWSEKFKTETSPDDEEYQSWLIDWFHRSRLILYVNNAMAFFKDKFINLPLFQKSPSPTAESNEQKPSFYANIFWGLIALSTTLITVYLLFRYFQQSISTKEILHVFLLGAATGLRVLSIIIISSIIWIPVGVWIGLKPRLAQRMQPIIQFAAAFPANLFYPLFVILIVTFKLNVEIWVTPLMILGTQWYILFNVIAGASQIPRDLILAADNFEVKGWLWWRKLALPGIFPFYITGAITAAGGAWNASIVAEWVSWGGTTLKATGLGEYIQANTISGNFSNIVLGTIMMCLYVLVFNHVLWRPLYRIAEERFQCY